MTFPAAALCSMVGEVGCRGVELRMRGWRGGFREGRRLVWICTMGQMEEGRSAGSLYLYGKWEFRGEGQVGGCFEGSHGHV
jgi:hypothetical protein